MKDRSDDPSHHELTLLANIYILIMFYLFFWGGGVVCDGLVGFCGVVFVFFPFIDLFFDYCVCFCLF